MYHVAIMNSKIASIDDILSGKKTIESRWSKNKVAPWGRVHPNDVIYFKQSGGSVLAKAEVEKVRQFEKKDFFQIEKLFEFPKIWAKNKNYCVLMWLKNPKKVSPFKINKSGFGSAAAWLSDFKVTSGGH